MAQDAHPEQFSSRREQLLPAQRSSGATPMMSQYLELKAANPGILLFHHMGDFYELFFEDAEIASRALGITLTRRGKHNGEDVPMCGVPVRTADEYLQKLIRLGHRVAVCEQVENPCDARKRGAKALLRREIVRLVTPGTITEDTLLEPSRHNYLLAIGHDRAADQLALAWADISTGEFFIGGCEHSRAMSEIARIDPRELLLPDALLSDSSFAAAIRQLNTAVTPLPSSKFDSIGGGLRLAAHFNVATLDGFGTFSPGQLGAAGALLDYVVLTQVGKVPSLTPPRRSLPSHVMLIDTATRGNLELTKRLDGGYAGSLLDVIDETLTGAGARLLAHRLSGPLTDARAINRRLDAVACLAEAGDLRKELRGKLSRVPEISRALGRLSLERGGPRDLAAIALGLRLAAEIAALASASSPLDALPEEISDARTALSDPLLAELASSITDALASDPPLLARDGNFVKPGYRHDLEEARKLRDESRRVIAGLQSAYAEKTGIRTLKIRHNNFLGHFIELNQHNGEALQSGPWKHEFIHRQTIVGGMRFTTVELAGLERRIAEAAEKALAIEMEVFLSLLTRVKEAAGAISRAADAIAIFDVTAALAELAVARFYTRPFVDNSDEFHIKGGRHPVVERILKSSAGGSFISNDCSLSRTLPDGRHLLLLTGPNMAGKSTYLRQNALIAILAQIGSFVPAAEAHLGTVDKLFSRVGAADDLARGRSTFMVEMLETAAILNQATTRSFVILDEIGRGTATFDGLSIAWATLEHLHEVNRCRCLFATHFHELTALASKLRHLGNASMKVREWQNDIIFLHEVSQGPADRSYGIHVARRAGLPASVVARAQEILDLLERNERTAGRRELVDDLPLFSAACQREPAAAEPSPLERRLAEIAPDELSPRHALELLYELRAMMREP
jgi:DNA mismatch repair protein MutS